MNWIDYAVLAIIGVSVLLSVMHGLVRELLSLAGWVAAFLVAQFFATDVAAMLPAEWTRKLVDTNVRTLTAAHLAWADLVFVSAMVVQRESARAIVARCKAAGRTVVAGGPLFQTEHEEFAQVDHFVLGEAELTLPQFLADFAAGRPQRVYRAEGYADVRTTPAPEWGLLELRRIRTGRSNDGLTEVLEGLKPGEKVVTKGGLFIDQVAVPASS